MQTAEECIGATIEVQFRVVKVTWKSK